MRSMLRTLEEASGGRAGTLEDLRTRAASAAEAADALVAAAQRYAPQGEAEERAVRLAVEAGMAVHACLSQVDAAAADRVVPAQRTGGVPFPDPAVQRVLDDYALTYVGNAAGKYTSMSGWEVNYYFSQAFTGGREEEAAIEKAVRRAMERAADRGTRVERVVLVSDGGQRIPDAPHGARAYVSVLYGQSIHL